MWPSLDWLAERQQRSEDSSSGPRGRTGLWDAMAQAVQRARQVSLATSRGPVAGEPTTHAEVIELTVESPHLAYLARISSSADGGRDDLPGADVIALVDLDAPEVP